MDDDDLQKGDEITPSLINSIQNSVMAIVVLSKNYASSSFCLQELSHILDSIKGKGRLVLPVFYKVDPSDVRKLKGTYGEAMDTNETKSNHKWKMCLHQVSNLSGFHYKNGDEYEHEFIGKIVEQVSREIVPITLPVPDNLVGIDYQKQNVASLLNVGSDDAVHMVGIHGIGGIGKTTLALEVYNSIVCQFQGSCFLENVRENSDKNGLIYLQKILLTQIFREKNIELASVRQGIATLKQRLKQKKILLVLDDVDKEEQLEAIAGSCDWFGLGSRVIITTRDKKLLTCHGVQKIYEVRGLNEKDAFELVGWKAFKNEFSPTYTDVLNRAVIYASGLPLALEVIGSHLFNKTVEECKYALDRYERIPDKKIQTVLQLSFDALQEEDKVVFLDIACCFKGYNLARLQKILHSHHGVSKNDHINVLFEKSLIKISKYHDVTLHDLIEDMGKEIVRQESPEEPGNRSRLWLPKDIVQVLEENTGTSKIEIICSNSRIKVEWDGEAFKKMRKLRTLIMSGRCSESPKHLPNSLRILQIENWICSSWGLPSEFYPKELTTCNFPSYLSSFEFKDFFKKASKFKNIRILNFDNHRLLSHIPDVSGLVNLEEFSFRECVSLTEVDDSVGLLGKLKTLNAYGCLRLRKLPPLKLVSLEELNLSECYRLESFPPVIDESFDKLKTLSVRCCFKIKSIPPLKLTSLQILDLSHCDSLESFPVVANGFLGNLKTLFVKGCRNLKIIPPLKLDSLEELDLSGCVSLNSFPCVVDGLLDKLKILSIKHCIKLTSIPPLKLTSLKQFDLSYCPSLESFPEILGEMRNIPQINLFNTPIKELPFRFQNLTPSQTLDSCNCGFVHLPLSVAHEMVKLVELTIHSEEKVSPMKCSLVKYLCLRNMKLSDESLSICLILFANVKELHLNENQFTVLPKCIEKCKFLWRLVLDNCEELQEIKGIPPSLKTLSALNCKSLTSSSKSKLLNQELHEAGNTWFRLPRAKIPDWFDHQCLAGLSISFWFRNKFPAIALCVVSPLTWYDHRPPIKVIINGNTFFYKHGEDRTNRNMARPKVYHLHLFHMKMEKLKGNMDKALLENKWNHAEVDFGFPFHYSGIHVLKEKSEMEVIRFTNPENDDNIELTL
uniref:NBS-LRR protein n=1 Tax=Cicer arietinum TaxID=3827 RepID=W0M0I8_CICAR|nr:NBS-LRR protein [Cicer arietinum]